MKKTAVLLLAVILAALSVFSVSAEDSRSSIDHQGVEYMLSLDGESYTVFDCLQTVDVITIPKEYKGKPVTEISYGAFYECAELRQIVLPQTLKLIGDSAFEGCVALESITIPQSVMQIQAQAFRGCEKLKFVEIPAKVSVMSADIFKGCTGLKDIYCQAESKPQKWDDGWAGDCSANIHWASDSQGANSDNINNTSTASEVEGENTSEPSEEQGGNNTVIVLAVTLVLAIGAFFAVLFVFRNKQ